MSKKNPKPNCEACINGEAEFCPTSGIEPKPDIDQCPYEKED